jgi:hypothetical protein
MNIYKLSRSLSFSSSCDVTFSTRCVFCRRFDRLCKHYAKNKVEGKVIQIHQKISKLDGVRLFHISLPQSENVILCVHAHCKPAIAANLSLGFDNLTAKLFHSFGILVHLINSYVDCDRFMTTWHFSFHHTSTDCLLAFVIGSCGKHPVFHRTRHLFHLPSKQVIVELVCTLYVVRRYFKMDYCMSHSTCFLSLFCYTLSRINPPVISFFPCMTRPKNSFPSGSILLSCIIFA